MAFRDLPFPPRLPAFLTAAALAMGLASLGACGDRPGQQTESNEAAAVGNLGIEQGTDRLQVGMVTVGPVTDWGWNYQHDQGRQALERDMANAVHTVIAENIPETADAERIMRRMAAAGAKLILSTSYGYADFAQRVAAQYPDVVFMQAQAPIQAPNASTYNAAIWEASYVAGVAAALTAGDATNFGFIGAHPIPPINWTVNAFTLGARSVNPNITVQMVYTNSWADPAAETEAVNSLASSGAVLVYGLVDSTISLIQAAEAAGLYSISHHADLSQFAPTKYVTGAIWNWGKLYEDLATQVINGTWQAGDVIGGLREGYVGLATFGPAVPDVAKTRAAAVTDSIKAGTLAVFQGPIYDQSGTLRVPAGQSLDVGAIVTMDWLVRGVRSVQ